MNNRTAYVSYKGINNNIFKLKAGVPQGALLSPTLYNIYLSDAPEPPRYAKDIVYADDVTQIIKSRRSLNHHNRKIRTEIVRMNTFEKTWKIQTNENKFKLLHFDKRRHPELKIGNKTINTSTEGTILGLRVTKIGYRKHITQIIIKGKEEMKKLYRFKNLSLKNKRKLYSALVASKITYPSIPLHAITNNQMKEIQRIQNKGA